MQPRVRASRSAKATEEISAQIGAVQHGTDGAVAAIGEIGAAIDGIRSAVEAIAQAVLDRAPDAVSGRAVFDDQLVSASGGGHAGMNAAIFSQMLTGTASVVASTITAIRKAFASSGTERWDIAFGLSPHASEYITQLVLDHRVRR